MVVRRRFSECVIYKVFITHVQVMVEVSDLM